MSVPVPTYHAARSYAAPCLSLFHSPALDIGTKAWPRLAAGLPADIAAPGLDPQLAHMQQVRQQQQQQEQQQLYPTPPVPALHTRGAQHAMAIQQGCFLAQEAMSGGMHAMPRVISRNSGGMAPGLPPTAPAAAPAVKPPQATRGGTIIEGAVQRGLHGVWTSGAGRGSSAAQDASDQGAREGLGVQGDKGARGGGRGKKADKLTRRGGKKGGNKQRPQLEIFDAFGGDCTFSGF